MMFTASMSKHPLGNVCQKDVLLTPGAYSILITVHTVYKVQIHVMTILILTSSSWHYHFGGTGLHIDRDTTVRDDKGNEHPEPRSLHSMTRYLGSFAKYIFRFCTRYNFVGYKSNYFCYVASISTATLFDI